MKPGIRKWNRESNMSKMKRYHMNNLEYFFGHPKIRYVTKIIVKHFLKNVN